MFNANLILTRAVFIKQYCFMLGQEHAVLSVSNLLKLSLFFLHHNQDPVTLYSRIFRATFMETHCFVVAGIFCLSILKTCAL